ncbi:Uma2 family endonuclease [soil metagenome]
MPEHLPSYTIADYEHWEGDWELIKGIPWSVRSSQIRTRPTRKWSRVLVELLRYIGNQVAGLAEANCEVVAQLDWAIDEHTVLRPDIAIIYCGSADFITQLPLVIIEISTPYTAVLDRKIKFAIYEEQQVPYYMLVNPETEKFITYVLINGKYVEHLGNLFQLPEGCTITIDVAKVLEELA